MHASPIILAIVFVVDVDDDDQVEHDYDVTADLHIAVSKQK